MIGVKEFLCRDPEELIGMTEGIEGIGMTFDFGHANTMGKVEDFLKYTGKAHHIHIHDNRGMSDEHLALGDGTVKWPVVGKTIAARYGGVIVIEGQVHRGGKEESRGIQEMFPMSGETLHIYFLGTAGALPTPLRNPPCIMIRRGSDTFSLTVVKVHSSR